MAGAAELGLVDEHAKDVAASVDDVWPVLLDFVDRAFTRPRAAAFAQFVGCADRAESGPRPLTEGSVIPGFRVSSARPNAELVLEGSHRFSTYRLTFFLTTLAPDRSRLCAESRAEFPGWQGACYRLAVVRSGGHAIAVRRLLAAVAKRCA